MIPRLIPAVLAGACLFGAVASAEQAPPPSAEALLRQVIATYRVGDLQGAWNAFLAFFEHPSRNELHINAFTDCFYDRQCPQPGALGLILDRPRSELEPRLEGFCPRLRSPEVEAALPPSALPERRAVYERIVANAFFGSCRAWQREQRELMFDSPSVGPRHADILPMAWVGDQDGGTTPAVALRVGAEPLRLVVDTGSSIGYLRKASPSFPGSAVTPLGHTRISTGVFQRYEDRPARLTSLQVGRTVLRPYQLDIADHRPGSWRHPIPRNGVLGMAFLLRYRAVCFAWDEQRLHLGGLGPCAGGLAPDRAHLLGSLLLGLATQARDGTRFSAAVDTGNWFTHCSAKFVGANADELEISFAAQRALVGKCHPNDAVLFQPAEYGFPQIYVGMNDLLRFRAFGWELNPLRVYFVPREGHEIGAPFTKS